MNIQLGNVLSDLSGVSGLRIIGAIWKESAIPGTWPLWSSRGKGHGEDIARPEGNWREELLFVLRHRWNLPDLPGKIADCDVQLRRIWVVRIKVDLEAQPIGPKPKGKKGSRNAPQFDLRTELYRITGIDWLKSTP